jgi:hypothetical protein
MTSEQQQADSVSHLDALLDAIQPHLKRTRRSYYVWFCIWLVLGLGAIALPLVAASPLFNEINSKILASIGALFAAAFGFLSPNTRAGEYHARSAQAKAVETDVRLGILFMSDLSDQLEASTVMRR